MEVVLVGPVEAGGPPEAAVVLLVVAGAPGGVGAAAVGRHGELVGEVAAAVALEGGGGLQHGAAKVAPEGLHGA